LRANLLAVVEGGAAAQGERPAFAVVLDDVAFGELGLRAELAVDAV